MFPNERNKITDDQWEHLFTHDFYLNYLQYAYLNRLERLKVEGEFKNRTAYFSTEVKVSVKDSTVYEKNRLLRSGNTLCFPVTWRDDNSLAAYSTKDKTFTYILPESWKRIKMAEIFLITKNGLEKSAKIEIQKKILKLELKAGQPYLIKPVAHTQPDKL